MYSRLRRHISQGNSFAALEITERTGRPFYGLLLVTREKEELRIIRWYTADTLSDITQYLPKKLPLRVIINSDKVLTKVAESISEEPSSQVLHAFPNLEINSFYFEIIQEKDRPVISISKKSYIDELLDTLKEAKIKTVGFHLGYSTLNSLLPYWASGNIQTSGIHIEMRDQQIVKLYPRQELMAEKYQVNGLDIDGDQLIALGGVLTFIQKHQIISNYGEVNDRLNTDFGYSRISEFVLKSTVAGILLLLLVNFFFFQYYHNQATKLNTQLLVSEDQQIRVQDLEVSVNRKLDKLERLNTSSWSMTSFYLDRLARDLPSSISLDRLTFQPLQVPVREDKPIQYKEGRIVLIGRTTQTGEISQWIAELEELSWIKTVETTEFSGSNGNDINFEIEITFDGTKS